MRWIKTYESLLDWEWFTDGNMLKLWTYLLLSANYRDKRWHGIEVKRGQLVTSRKELGKRLKMTERVVRTCLSRLVDSGEITLAATNKYSLLTICKYEEYQSNETEERPTNDQQNDQQTTNKTTNKRPTKISPQLFEDLGNSMQPTGESDQQTDQQTTNKTTNKTTTTLEDIESIESNSLTKVSVSFPQKVLEFFNQRMEGNVIPKIRGITKKRQSMINARVREHGEEAVFEMIRKASESDFLNGKNNRGWTATFDWLFLPSNFQKVLEDNYRNNETNSTNNEREQRAAAYAATIASLAAQDDARKGDVW